MKNFIKSLIFTSVTSSLLLSSIAWGASARPTVSAADTKVSATMRRIIQLPGLSQDADYIDYGNYNLCGFYTAFFITKMMRAVSSGDYGLLKDRRNFDGFFLERTFRPDIEDNDIQAILTESKVANTCYVAIDVHGVFYPPVLQALENLKLNQPIGLAINFNRHWIAGMVTIDDTGVVLRVVDSLGHDCVSLPIVTTIYDYFVKQAQGMKLAAAGTQTAAAVAQALDAEAKEAAEQLVRQRVQRQRDDEKAAKMAAALAERFEAVERARREKAAADDEALARAYQEALRLDPNAPLYGGASTSNARSATSTTTNSQKISKATTSVDAKLAQAQVDRATAKLIKQLQIESDAAVARQLQEQQDLDLARQLSGSSNSSSSASSSAASASASRGNTVRRVATAKTPQQQMQDRVQRLKRR